jgi:hypothetical protein
LQKPFKLKNNDGISSRNKFWRLSHYTNPSKIQFPLWNESANNVTLLKGEDGGWIIMKKAQLNPAYYSILHKERRASALSLSSIYSTYRDLFPQCKLEHFPLLNASLIPLWVSFFLTLCTFTIAIS